MSRGWGQCIRKAVDFMGWAHEEQPQTPKVSQAVSELLPAIKKIGILECFNARIQQMMYNKVAIVFK